MYHIFYFQTIEIYCTKYLLKECPVVIQTSDFQIRIPVFYMMYIIKVQIIFSELFDASKSKFELMPTF